MARLFILVVAVLVLSGACRAAIDVEWDIGLRASSDSRSRAYCIGTASVGVRSDATDGPPADPLPIDSWYTEPNPRLGEVDCVDLSVDGRWQVDRRAPLTAGEKTWHLIVYAGDSFTASTIYLTVWNPAGVSDASPDDGLRIVLYSVQFFGGPRTLVGELDLSQNGSFTQTGGITGYYLQTTWPFARGLSGDLAHPYRFELVASVGESTAPTVTDDGAYTSGTGSLHASWAAPDSANVLEYEYAIGTSPENLLVGWTSAGLSTDVTRTGLSLQPDSVYHWYVRARYASGWSATGASDGIRAAKACSVGDSRTQYAGRAVCISDVVVTSLPTDPAGLWLVSGDRSAGVKVDVAWTCDIGDRLDVAGIVSWIDGVPVLTSPEMKSHRGGTPLCPLAVTERSVANDRTESLAYEGPNMVGLPVVVAGWVTGVDSAANAFYIDDGSGLCDGMGSAGAQYAGLRIESSTGAALPAVGAWVRVSGIRTVRKTTLAHDAYVNGTLRQAGEVLYLPVVAARG